MTCLVLTYKTKDNNPPQGDVYWSRAFGAFSREDQATHLPDWDAAQVKVRELRKHNPGCYFYAITL